MKFLADVPIPQSLVAWLRARGHEGYHAAEASLAQASDVFLLARAKHEGRVVLTMDLDFPRLLALTAAHSPSVILFRLPDARPERLSDLLAIHLSSLLPHLERGAIAVIEPDRIRFRLLPIDAS